jgi:hypothetical protein
LYGHTAIILLEDYEQPRDRSRLLDILCCNLTASTLKFEQLLSEQNQLSSTITYTVGGNCYKPVVD